MLAVTPDSVYLDGRRVTPDEAGDDLALLRRNWDIVQPGRPFPGSILILADRSAPYERIRPYLRAAAAADFAHLQFAVQAL